MPAAAEPRGLKRICMGCGTRFYDLNKRPIICPSCRAEFTVEVKTKGRKARIANDDSVKVAVVESAGKETEEIEIVEGEEDVVSLEDVDDDDADDDDDDLALEDDIGDLDDLEKDDEEEEKEETKE